MAEHEVTVLFESAAELSNDDISFDAKPAYDVDPSTDEERGPVRVFASRRSKAALIRITTKDGRVCYALSNEHDTCV